MPDRVQVLILMGSDSDLPVMEETGKVLAELGISSKMTVSSAHRTPERTRRLIEQAEKEGVGVIIAGAGAAAHLAGVAAAHTIVPVIGVPIDSSPLAGWDALLATVQMPPGIPVATMAVGRAGARNAGILAAQILALENPEIRSRLQEMRAALAKAVEEKAARVEKT
jgi:phosphoribosylaminoimidazole carboxylase PurE protein